MNKVLKRITSDISGGSLVSVCFLVDGILGIGEKTSATFIYDQKKFGLGITVTIFLESC